MALDEIEDVSCTSFIKGMRSGVGNAGTTGAVQGRHPNSARFHEILKELGDLHDKKQADYGNGSDPFANVRASSEWGMPAWVGCMVRLTDKVRRLQSLARKGSLANESAADSFRDIAVYAAIGLVLYEQEQLSEVVNVGSAVFKRAVSKVTR